MKAEKRKGMKVTDNLSHTLVNAVYPPRSWGEYMKRGLALSNKALVKGLVQESLYWATVCSELTLWPKAALEDAPIVDAVWDELERGEVFVDSVASLIESFHY
jgi:hypothetical protein